MGNTNAALAVIGIALLIFVLAVITELASWYVRSEIPTYVIASFITLILLSGITQNKYKKLSGYLGATSGILLIIHLVLSISAN